jgi:16S rRNA (guanine966-N2)-methyltransferase
MTRIISGIARGRTLKVPAKGTRPTSDRVRESLFSALQSRLLADGLNWTDICVLDLYAGSGALGLEALSRGAREVWLIENNRAAAAVIASNIETLGLPGAHILSSDAAVVARVRPPNAAAAKFVLADPPYDVSISVIRTLVTDLVAAGWLAEDAHVVIERPARENESPFPEDWENQSRRMGDTVLWYGRAVGEDGSASELSVEGS